MAFIGSFAYLVLEAPGIVKPGYSDDYRERMTAHRFDGKLALACLRVSNGLAAERAIMASLAEAGFRHRTDLGREYFEGDVYEAMRLFWYAAFPLASAEPLTHAARREAALASAAPAEADEADKSDESDEDAAGAGVGAEAPPPAEAAPAVVIPADPLWQVTRFLGPLVNSLAGQTVDATDLYTRMVQPNVGRPPVFTRFIKVAEKLYRAKMTTLLDGRTALQFPASKLKNLNKDAVDDMQRFLLMNKDERKGIVIARAPGRVTWKEDFVHAYTMVIGKEPTMDAAALHQLGFRLSSKRENVCKSCKQIAASGKCCAAYAGNDRGKKIVIYDMSITSAS